MFFIGVTSIKVMLSSDSFIATATRLRLAIENFAMPEAAHSFYPDLLDVSPRRYNVLAYIGTYSLTLLVHSFLFAKQIFENTLSTSALQTRECFCETFLTEKVGLVLATLGFCL